MKTFRILTLIAAMLTLSAVSAGGAERIVRCSKEVKALNVTAGQEVKLIPAPASSGTQVSIKGAKDMISYIQVYMQGSTLYISVHYRDKKRMKLHDIDITVTGPVPPSITASAGAEIECATATPLKFDALSLATSSGAEIELPGVTCNALSVDTSSGGEVSVANLQCTSLSASATSGGTIDIKAGKVGSANLSATSGGKIDAYDVQCKVNNIVNSSGGSVKIGQNSVK